MSRIYSHVFNPATSKAYCGFDMFNAKTKATIVSNSHSAVCSKCKEVNLLPIRITTMQTKAYPDSFSLSIISDLGQAYIEIHTGLKADHGSSCKDYVWKDWDKSSGHYCSIYKYTDHRSGKLYLVLSGKDGQSISFSEDRISAGRACFSIKLTLQQLNGIEEYLHKLISAIMHSD